MSIASTDLIPYCSLNMPENDTGASGGGIDVDNRPVFTQLAANDTLEILSDNAGDTTQSVTVTGRNAAGDIISDTKTLSGTTPVSLTGTFERVLKVSMSADAAGTVTVRRASAGPTVCTIPAGERGVHCFFYDSASEAGATTRWEKMFWKNIHGTLSLTSAKVQLNADPSSKIRQGITASKDDSSSVSNRKTDPSVTYVDDGVDQNVPTGSLGAGEAIGVWYELQLTADDSPYRSTFTSRVAGNTT